MMAAFYRDSHNLRVAQDIKNYINTSEDFLSSRTASSTRAAGDAIENLISERLEGFLGNWCADYSADFPRRAMADLAFTDTEGFRHFVDVKTHRLDTRFNMPNLTSVKRIVDFYEKSDKNVFSLVMVKYRLNEAKVDVSDVIFTPIESLNWDCLTVGALGWGQIQIANSNVINVNSRYSRREWMLRLCDEMQSFYPREIAKAQGRIRRFNRAKSYWESHQDT